MDYHQAGLGLKGMSERSELCIPRINYIATVSRMSFTIIIEIPVCLTFVSLKWGQVDLEEYLYSK